MDNAISIGTAIHKQLTAKKFGDITMKRSQAQTFSIMLKSVKDVVNGKSFGGPAPSQESENSDYQGSSVASFSPFTSKMHKWTTQR
jgi:hypothetical protein